MERCCGSLRSVSSAGMTPVAVARMNFAFFNARVEQVVSISEEPPSPPRGSGSEGGAAAERPGRGRGWPAEAHADALEVQWRTVVVGAFWCGDAAVRVATEGALRKSILGNVTLTASPPLVGAIDLMRCVPVIRLRCTLLRDVQRSSSPFQFYLLPSTFYYVCCKSVSLIRETDLRQQGTFSTWYGNCPVQLRPVTCRQARVAPVPPSK